jgi:hypothetical protein
MKGMIRQVERGREGVDIAGMNTTAPLVRFLSECADKGRPSTCGRDQNVDRGVTAVAICRNRLVDVVPFHWAVVPPAPIVGQIATL